MRKNTINTLMGTLFLGCTISTAKAQTESDSFDFPWSYIAEKDYGIRSDGWGDGRFLEDRGGGAHSGIDYLMPVGTKLKAACSGDVLTGYDSGYGYWVQLVCKVPSTLTDSSSHWASLLYAHMNSISVASGSDVSAGQFIGTSGKSGNANQSGLNPHLHFEIVIRDSYAQAKNEMHRKGDETRTGNYSSFLSGLKRNCTEPLHLRSQVRFDLGNRIDPFVLVSCLSSNKPALSRTSNQGLIPWSSEYSADFDVDVGQR